MGLLKRMKYAPFGKFNMKKYWHDRYEMYPNMRGSGKVALTNTENEIIYEYFIDEFKSLLPNTNRLNVMDIGCGMGYYTNLLNSYKTKKYHGIDISQRCISDLITQFEMVDHFSFHVCDFTKSIIVCPFRPNVVMCIDVTQHIIRDSDLAFLLNQLKK